MKEYIVLMEYAAEVAKDGQWYFPCSADDATHAEEQALDSEPACRAVAVYERIR
jgi:protein-disulfide isomerase-like protein with CxxC motif